MKAREIEAITADAIERSVGVTSTVDRSTPQIESEPIGPSHLAAAVLVRGN
jgi:hypothetical protein